MKFFGLYIKKSIRSVIADKAVGKCKHIYTFLVELEFLFLFDAQAIRFP